MRMVSNNLKNALKQPTVQRKGKILVNNNYYEVYNLEYFADCYNEGNVVGNAIASQLDFDLPTIGKFDTFKYFDGIWTGTDYEFVDMGTFNVFDENDEDEFNTHITAFDNLIKFNVPFIDKQDYPKSVFQELQNICEQAGVELENESIVNGNFIIESNPFIGGENLKSVLKAICQISGTFGIIKNDKLYLQLKNETTEVLNKGEHEPVVWKRRTYGINQLILGMADVEGEYVLRQDDDDIAINGVHKLVINDNPFVFTEEKRNLAIDNLFEQVKGFGYVPFDLKGEWLNYIEIGDTITIDNIDTIVLRINGKSPESLDSVISAPAIIDSAIEYVNNTNSLEKRVNRTEIVVDKANQQIQAVVQTVEGSASYDLTQDTQYQPNKEYYKFDMSEYVLLQEGTDYNIGDDIVGNVYEYNFTEGLEERVSRNEFNIDSQKTTINIISTNINTENGDIESVKTTTGYTLDKDGLKIKKDVNDYNTLIDNTGTYYKDGDTILSQTTKDGTITKDMVLYGKYYYGVREDLDVANFKKDDAMFVAELYTDNNGEEGFGHFWNGGDM